MSLVPIASDNFTRANGGLGTNWTTVDNAAQVVSNNFDSTAAAGVNCGAAWTANAFPHDQYSTANYVSNAGANNMSLYVLMTGSGASSGYYAVYSPGGGSTQWTIYIESSGGFTQLSAAAGVTLTNGDVVLFTVVGNTLSVYVNGSLITSVTGVLTITTGTPGLGTSHAGNTWGNWSGGEIISQGWPSPTQGPSGRI